MSAAFCAGFGVDAADTVGRSCFAFGAGAWNIPELRRLLKATSSGASPAHSIEFDLKRPGQAARRLVAKAERLIYAEPSVTHLVLSVADVTDLRATEQLREEIHQSQALVVHEVRHRVTNSLQIVASVLLLNARATQSEDARGQLEAAYSRVMAVAALERQLSEASDDQVELGDYFRRLCANMSGSAIADPERVVLRSFVDPVVVSSSTAACLGMIVTELIINALKHAFPGARRGNVTVAFDAKGSDWILTVGDNGVGMPDLPPTNGLGTEIVKALVRQLGASVAMSDAFPGVIASIRSAAAPRIR
ncbi:sensor histidine kinase [Phenylobacterium sp.]|uniref:sensor histidine kinase n=1 Tax=Phenylobacterium sp. TaxID=1871053 RepID=UPI0025CCD1FA|nr:sensor histidine kinase [Phenylobacterium sp.]